MFAAKTKRQAEPAEPQTKPRRKLTRAERKQIEAAIARANRTGKKEQSAQDSIPYERMWPDGICKVADGRYTKTIQFQDINYQLSQNEDKTAIFEGWCDFLNYFDSSIRFQLSFLNLAASQETFANSITIPAQGDDFDPIRVEYTHMENNLTYIQNGDYLIPDLRLSEQPMKPLGKYGRMRKAYLKQHRPILYNQLLMTEKLYPHLLEIDETANRRLEQMMPQLAEAAGATEALKAADPMQWVGLMNTCKAQAEEILMAELINS